MLNFYPAIDLKDGNCVRLYQGDMGKATIFSHDAGAQAKQFVDAGTHWLHMVDLNGAFEGKSVNTKAVQQILQQTKNKAKTQLGGGIRSLKHMEFWLEQGVDRLILGTIALTNPDLVKQACSAFSGHIAVGIDAKDGYVATQGWVDVSDVSTEDLARSFQDAGVSAIIHTDIARDGAMQGPNLEASCALAKMVDIPVIISGGVSSMDDLKKIKELGNHRIDGVIAGRAIYDGVIDVAHAIQLFKD